VLARFTDTSPARRGNLKATWNILPDGQVAEKSLNDSNQIIPINHLEYKGSESTRINELPPT
jgi:hypothetical protein